MDIYTSVEDSLYDFMKIMYPDLPVIHGYTDASEPVTPFCNIFIINIDPVGRESFPTLTDEDENLTVTQNYEILVRFEFVGDSNTSSGGLAHDFQSRLIHPNYLYYLRRFGFSYMRKGTTRPVPKKRETQFFMANVIDVVFAYSVDTTERVDVIESVVINGNYGDIQTIINVPDPLPDE